MLSGRQIRTKIKSIESTKKLTKAIEMVSVVKLKDFEGKIAAHIRYCRALELVAGSALAHAEHPLCEKKIQSPYRVLCIITSDTGLCGSYNQNVLRAVQEYIKKHGRDYVRAVCVGKKGFVFCKKQGITVSDVYLDMRGKFSSVMAEKLLGRVMEMYTTKEIMQVCFAYTQFISAGRWKACVEQLLALIPPDSSERQQEYLAEPDSAQIQNKIIPLYLRSKMESFLLQSFAAEHAARSMAMHEATNNAKELLEGLILLRNKLRQTVITAEIMEVISSVEALKR